jgi:hypothetical protein
MIRGTLLPALAAALSIVACAAGVQSPPAASNDAELGRITSYCYATPRQQVLDRVKAHFAKCYAKAGAGHTSYVSEASAEGGRLVVKDGIRDVLVAQVKSGAQTCIASLEVRAVDATWAKRFAVIDAAAKGEAGGC